MDGPSNATSTNSRQKRVLPSRSRRGGPGLGSCEIDNLILETQRRKSENEPLIPADTRFLLTTDPDYDAEPSEGPQSGIKINIVANERYFDRPEVLKAFREQSLIQTPEFHDIQDDVSGVGGRFRPRGQEEYETSDAAYEKRHKKFESYEKRQRLREKEKLKHEHYKLKERIEQLRAMEAAAFMNLPESSFSPLPSRPLERDEVDDGTSFMAMNGGIYHAEGERRRKEMLDFAVKLERRYAYLLPPDRVRKGQDSSSTAVGSSNGIDPREEEDSDGERRSTVGPSRRDSLKLRLPGLKSSASSTPTPSPRLSSKPSHQKKARQAPSISRATSARSRRKSSPPPAHPLPPTEQRPIFPSTISPTVDIEQKSPEPGRKPTSPPPSASPKPPSVAGDLTPAPSTRDSPGPDDATQQEARLIDEPLPATNGTRIIWMPHEPNHSPLPQSPSAMPGTFVNGLDLVVAGYDGESEKTISEVGEPIPPLEAVEADIESPIVQRSKLKTYMRKGKQEAKTAELFRGSATPEAPPEPKKKQTKKTKVKAAGHGQQHEEEIVPTKGASTSVTVEDLQDGDTREQVSKSPRPSESAPGTDAGRLPASEPPEGSVAQVGTPSSNPPEESISARPSKRRKQEEVVWLGQSTLKRQTSAQLSEVRFASQRRKQPYLDYFSQSLKMEVRTFSTLIIAADRLKDGHRRVAKDRYAFGNPTPEFHKQQEVEFDLPIYFRYASYSTVSDSEEEVDELDTESSVGRENEKGGEESGAIEKRESPTEEDEVGVEEVIFVTRRGESHPPNQEEDMDISDAENTAPSTRQLLVDEGEEEVDID